ncbi:hypothetical protein Mal48_27230 [Thalassoglobus polymorphus]|uniref:Uncharacterized protein n=1 Tax=Thalassoglobus polymorphus TaxID=2527994 RepID=A0A517QP90_9PLAN|nr:hypothetical protein Mal48_27230 [Thalassoglobus polymorphus]
MILKLKIALSQTLRKAAIPEVFGLVLVKMLFATRQILHFKLKDALMELFFAVFWTSVVSLL